MQQPKHKSNDPGVFDREACFPPPRTNNLRPQKEDAQRHSSIEWRKRYASEAERGNSQGYTVGYSKGGNGFQQLHPALHNQEQPQNKEKMVNAEHYVMKAKGDIFSCSGGP